MFGLKISDLLFKRYPILLEIKRYPLRLKKFNGIAASCFTSDYIYSSNYKLLCSVHAKFKLITIEHNLADRFEEVILIRQSIHKLNVW